MINQTEIIKFPVKHPAQPDAFYIIPTPFENKLRDKEMWHADLKKMETGIKAVRLKMQELSQRQIEQRKVLLFFKEYCYSLSKKRMRKPKTI